MKLICKSSRSCKLDSATTTRRNHHSWVALTRMEVHREKTGSPQGTDRNPQGTDRKSTGHRQEVHSAQTGSPQGTDRKATGHRQEGAILYFLLPPAVPL